MPDEPPWDPDNWTPAQKKQLGEMCLRAHRMFTEEDGVTIGQAIARAAAQLDIVLDERLEEAAVRSLGRVVFGGGIEAAARAQGILPKLDKN